MALELLSPEQEKRIVSNLIKAARDVTKLSKQSYKWISICSGFIAEYDHHGFISAYKENFYRCGESLGHSIKSHQPDNQWQNFRPGERDYEYQMQKKKMYNQICEAI